MGRIFYLSVYWLGSGAYLFLLTAEWCLFTHSSSLRQERRRMRWDGSAEMEMGGGVGGWRGRRKRLMRRETLSHWCWLTQQRHHSHIPWVCAHHGGAWTHLSPSPDGRTYCVWVLVCAESKDPAAVRNHHVAVRLKMLSGHVWLKKRVHLCHLRAVHLGRIIPVVVSSFFGLNPSYARYCLHAPDRALSWKAAQLV